ncbi:MAG: S9 family peptidase [Planctomycetes bacterium]|nr:S9 family peptidase [Planctomycetota bacterium]
MKIAGCPLFLTLAALALATGSPLARGQGGAEEGRFTVEDLWAVKRVGNPVLSPDGLRVAYTVTRYDLATNQANADIFVRELAGGEAWALTTDAASDSAPQWSPDGKAVVFVSKRAADKGAQLYWIDLAGGEARRLTEMLLPVSSPRFTPDGKRIVFVSSTIHGFESPESLKAELEAREKKLVKAKVTENRLYRYWDTWLADREQLRLYALELATGKVTDLLFGWKGLFDLSGENQSISFDISPDSKQVVFAANSTPPPYRALNQDLFIVGIGGGMQLNLTSDNPADDLAPVFSPDGRTVLYGRKAKAQGYPDRVRLAAMDLASRKTTVLSESWDHVPADWQFAEGGRSIVFRAEVRARNGLYSMPFAPLGSGEAPRCLLRGGTVSGFDLSAGGEVLYTASTLLSPPEVFLLPLAGGEPRPISRVNEQFMAGFQLGTVEDMTFPGAGDDPVQMFVCMPPGFDAGRKWPLVQLIHGGPVGTFGDAFSFRWNPLLFTARGTVVAMVNFHGSSSFGQAWVESILGAHPDKPFTDVMKSTDFLIAKGFIDERRLAAAGGSYGGFLVNWIAGHTDRFAALVSHAGVFSLHGQMASDSTEGRQWSYGGFPFDNLENVEKWSPNRYSKHFTTPMLVLHGERDFRVPVGQGLELYGVLQAKGVSSRLVVFPDENHWILKGQNSVLWYNEVLGWIGRWLQRGR